MKSTPNFIKSRMRQVTGFVRMTTCLINRSISKTPLTDFRYLSVVAAVLLFCTAGSVTAQSGGTITHYSSDTPLEIPDEGTIISELNIRESGPIKDLNVKVTITHSYDADMDVFLIAPDGTRIELFTDVGDAGEGFVDTVLDDQSATPIEDGEAPFSGQYRPEGSLADVVNMDIHGLWSLEVTDDGGDDIGTLESWGLIAVLQPDEPLPAPIIEAKPQAPGDPNNKVVWNDVGQTTEYESTVAEEIPGEGTLSQTIEIRDLGIIEDLNVKVNISHEWDSELDVYLVAPDGTRIELFTDVGGSKDHFIDTVLDDQSDMSIIDGTAPFTGEYRPEGSLDALIGKDVQGVWTLEITDDSWYASGTLNSWSLIVNVADVLYYVECATDADFSNIVADSGWITNKSHLFSELDQNSKYWYRAKARPLKTWSQTTLEDFEADVLTEAEAVDPGDVILPGGGGGLGRQVRAIENPSFEQNGGWYPDSNNFILLFLGMGPLPADADLWVSDGDWAIAVLFTDDFSWSKGDYGDWVQTVDWTGVDTLVLDYCGVLAFPLVGKVLIGDNEVWSSGGPVALMDIRGDITIDVSGFTGTQDLILRTEVVTGGSFLAGILWDNIRTYSTSSPPAGSVISAPISIGSTDSWGVLEFDATIPEETQLTVDVLPATDSIPIEGYENVPPGMNLSALNERTIRLRANLSTTKQGATPVLHKWSVTFGTADRESEWSNVVSSLP